LEGGISDSWRVAAWRYVELVCQGSSCTDAVLQNSTVEQYSDAPTYPQHTCPATSSDSTSKPYRILPHQTQPPAYSDEQPYRDDPPSATAAAIQAQTSPAYTPPPRHHMTLPPRPYAFYTDASIPSTPNNDDVPLAHLHMHPTPLQLSAQEFYPLEAPPAYSVAIGQSHDSSIAYYVNYGAYGARQGAFMDGDEEAGPDEEVDDAEHSVEKAVAMFVVASMLLVLSAVLAWLALGSGLFA